MTAAALTQSDWERAAAIYLPLTAALLLRILRGPQPRRFAACLLSLLWTALTLTALQKLNLVFAWWTFPPDASSQLLFCGMPLELLVGWTILWGILPQLAFPRLAIPWQAVILAIIDLILMPQLSAVLHLGPYWLLGETLALLAVLLPALALARCTLNGTRLRLRALMQVAISAMLFLFLVPEIAFALRPGNHWKPLLTAPGWQMQIELQLIFLLAIPGLSAVMEFAERGRGTPIPYDPPKSLVTTGIYRYVANPMQLSCALVMLAWAAILKNPWLLLAAGLSLIYSAGIASWDEKQSLALRFGSPWRDYRASVRNWLPRWRPYHAGPPARLYIDLGCLPCSQLQRWFTRRNPLSLTILDARSLPYGSITRMRYDPGDHSPIVDGIRALGRALEHLHFLWAIAGAALRLPILCQLVQLLMDASGLGPRTPAAFPACPLPALSKNPPQK
jgi:protein-S-isoprenylcysteine O-methyltransferase Ste14